MNKSQILALPARSNIRIFRADDTSDLLIIPAGLAGSAAVVLPGTQQAYNVENVEGSYTLDRRNGPRQYGMMVGSTTIRPPDNFEEGQILTLSFYTNGGEWDLYFDGSIQMSEEAEAALPITLPNGKAYIIELQMSGFLPVLTAFHGPTNVQC